MKFSEIFSENEVDSVLRGVLGEVFDRDLKSLPFRHRLYIYLKLLLPGVNALYIVEAVGNNNEIPELTVDQFRRSVADGRWGLAVLRGVMTLEPWSDDYPLRVCPVHRIPLQRGDFCPLCRKEVEKPVRLFKRRGLLSDRTGTVRVLMLTEDAPVEYIVGGKVTVLVHPFDDEGELGAQVIRVLKSEPLTAFTVPSGGSPKVGEETEKRAVPEKRELPKLPPKRQDPKEKLREMIENARMMGKTVCVGDLAEQVGLSEEEVEKIVGELGYELDEDGCITG